MKSVWTWGGKFFGSIEGDKLWTYKGKHVGVLEGTEIYDRDGHYLGESMDDRLITINAKKSHQGSSFSPNISRVGTVPSVGCVGNVMNVGHSDFPGPEEF